MKNTTVYNMQNQYKVNTLKSKFLKKKNHNIHKPTDSEANDQLIDFQTYDQLTETIPHKLSIKQNINFINIIID